MGQDDRGREGGRVGRYGVMGFRHLYGYHMPDLIFMASTGPAENTRRERYTTTSGNFGPEFMAFRRRFTGTAPRKVGASRERREHVDVVREESTNRSRAHDGERKTKEKT